jgi:hypothetical protein
LLSQSAAPVPPATPEPSTAGGQPTSQPVNGQFTAFKANGSVPQGVGQGAAQPSPTQSAQAQPSVSAEPDPIGQAITATQVMNGTASLTPTAVPGATPPPAAGLGPVAQVATLPPGPTAAPTVATPSPTPEPVRSPESDGGLIVNVPDSQTRMFLAPLAPAPTPCASSGCPPAQQRWRVVQAPPGMRPEDQYDAESTAGIGSNGLSLGGSPAPAAGERGADQQQLPTSPTATPAEGQRMVVLVPVPVTTPAPGTTPTAGPAEPPQYAVVQLVYRGGAWVPETDTAEAQPLAEARSLAGQLAGTAAGGRVVVAAPPEQVATPEPTPEPNQYWSLALSPEIKEVFSGGGLGPALRELVTPRGFIFTGIAMVSSLTRTYPTYRAEYLAKGLAPDLAKEAAWRRAMEYSLYGSAERDVAERVILDYDFLTGAVWNVGVQSALNTGMILGIEGLNWGITRGLAPGGLVQRAVAPLRASLGPQSGPVRLADKITGANLLSGLKWWQIPLQSTLIYAFSDIGTPLAMSVGLLDKPVGHDEFGQPKFADTAGYAKWLAWEAGVVNGLPASLFATEYLWEKVAVPAAAKVPWVVRAASTGQAVKDVLANMVADAAKMKGLPEVGLIPEAEVTVKLATTTTKTMRVITPASMRLAAKAGVAGFLTFAGLSLISNLAANSPWGRAQIANFERLRLNPDKQSFSELNSSYEINDTLGNLQYYWSYFDRNLIGATNPLSAALALPRAVGDLAESWRIIHEDFPAWVGASLAAPPARFLGFETYAAQLDARAAQLEAVVEAHNERMAQDVEPETEAAVNEQLTRAEEFRRLAMEQPMPTEYRELLDYWRLNFYEQFRAWGSEQNARWGTVDVPPDPVGVVQAQLRRQVAGERAGRAWAALWGGTPAMTEEERQQRRLEELRRQLQGTPTVGPTQPAAP